MIKNILYIIFLASAFFSCERIIMHSPSATTSTAIFEEYVKVVKEKYAMLEFKGVDINHLADSIRPMIVDEMPADSLFTKLGIIVERLRDGHTNLVGEINGEQRYKGYDFIEGYPISFDPNILTTNYIGKSIAPDITWLESGNNVRAVYGVLPQHSDIGYIHIPSFNAELSDDELEAMFSKVANTKGLIVDIRNNTGGDPILATKFAAYFTDKNVSIGLERFKTGPGANDFSDSPATLKPANSSNLYLKPVMVCTNRPVYSAASTFCYSVNPLSHVKFVGQRTGGGSGSVASGYLANGWIWSLSVSEFIGIDDNGNDHHLDNGFEPDIVVALDTMDKSKDEIVEKAIIELQ